MSWIFVVAALKADRKRLKAEKFDVLNQMKQLYATLEDKEKELRDFIRSYEKVKHRHFYFFHHLLLGTSFNFATDLLQFPVAFILDLFG